MRAIDLVMLEADDGEAPRLLTALSEGGVGCRVRRAAGRDALRAALDAGRPDAIVAGSAVPGCPPPLTLEEARAHAPDVPIVFIARGDLDDAFDWLAAGAAACVPAHRLDRLAPAVQRAVAEADRRRDLDGAAHRRDDFLARVAHQIRTPLNALLGWASLLRTRRLDETARARALETIERNARVQARMIEDLLDVSRMISQRIHLEAAEVELCPAVAAAVEAVRPAADAAGVTLGAELDESVGAAIADPRRLDQVVRELLGNAVRATPSGGRVDLRLVREGARARIEVRDTGRGIAKETLPHLFDGLRRVDRPAHHGLGVGLWIVRYLVEEHGGSVEAESEGEGRGAVFTVRLPLAAA